MDRLRMETKNKANENFKKLIEMFPNVVTESIDENGDIVRSIDKDILMQEINCKVVEGTEERYQFTWPDKKKSILLANAPISKTLRPCREESVNFDTTENLYIEGDNLEILKLLQETYFGKIKMIYIDPPYNTGNDLIYADNFKQSIDKYREISREYDNQGNRLFINSDSNGRFHTDWLNMIYPRLKLSKDLLSDDGVIFISIDDNELDSLKKICDEIFGGLNFVGCICRATGTTTGQDSNKIGSSCDYCLVYSKSSNFFLNGINMDDKDLKRFKEVDNRGNYSILQLRKTGNADRREDRPSMFYSIEAPDGTKVYPFGPSKYLSRWRVSKESYNKLIQENMIVWKKQTNYENINIDGYIKSPWVPYVKYYLKGRTKQISNLFQNIEGNKKASILLKDLLGITKVFNNPKPVEFLKILLQIATNSEDYVLDFFSGSATTSHAVMKLNAEDGGNRRFIMIQLPEETSEGSEAYKAGYKNICEIGKERIRRAGKKIIEENKDKEGIENLDIGFRVLKCDSSNMKDVYYNPAEYEASLFDDLTDNIKEDRSSEDLLFQVMLDLGVELSSKIKETVINGKKVFNVSDGFLIVCFDDNVTEEIIKVVAKQKPYYFVMRDSSMANDSVATNFEQIFSMYSPNTIRRIL